jgi:hypothetical protein
VRDLALPVGQRGRDAIDVQACASMTSTAAGTSKGRSATRVAVTVTCGNASCAALQQGSSAAARGASTKGMRFITAPD